VRDGVLDPVTPVTGLPAVNLMFIGGLKSTWRSNPAFSNRFVYLSCTRRTASGASPLALARGRFACQRSPKCATSSWLKRELEAADWRRDVRRPHSLRS
jgi:hypothetical protein